MHHAHGIGYELYKRQHLVRMAVERAREQEYVKSRSVVSHHQRQLFNHI
ncbi:hypothetical protein [Bacillus chungangensis]|nr:hypothetical protein [Bacillus chungangensis]